MTRKQRLTAFFTHYNSSNNKRESGKTVHTIKVKIVTIGFLNKIYLKLFKNYLFSIAHCIAQRIDAPILL